MPRLLTLKYTLECDFRTGDSLLIPSSLVMFVSVSTEFAENLTFVSRMLTTASEETFRPPGQSRENNSRPAYSDNFVARSCFFESAGSNAVTIDTSKSRSAFDDSNSLTIGSNFEKYSKHLNNIVGKVISGIMLESVWYSRNSYSLEPELTVQCHLQHSKSCSKFP